MNRVKEFLCLMSFSGFAAQTVIASDEGVLRLETELSQSYLNEMRLEPNTLEIENGILLREIHKIESEIYPTLESQVTVIIQGFDRRGRVFTSSLERDEASVFSVNSLIPCLRSALPLISQGSVYKVTCPAETAYGDDGVGEGGILPGAAISFRVILLEVLN